MHPIVAIILPAFSIGAGSDAPTGPRVADYAPGVRIDWPTRRVEVEALVVLREGPLELFACSPHTREHESIVVTPAQPLRIREAMGLIGLTAGHPVQYDSKTDQWSAATGDRITVEARWLMNGKERRADIGEWMKDLASGKTLPPNAWVFSGSYATSEGQFAADADGTVMCVVDFASALIAVPALHTSANEALWIAANTDKIPPIGTKVTLVIGAAEAIRFEISIGPRGELTHDKKAMSMKRLVERIKLFQEDHRSTAIVIHADPAAPRELVTRVEETIRLEVIPGTEVRIETPRPAVKLDRGARARDSGRP